MPTVTCPSCGERGKIGSSFIGSRLKCKKCGLSFLVSAPVAKQTAGPTAAVSTPPQSRRPEESRSRGWTRRLGRCRPRLGWRLKAEATAEPDQPAEAGTAFVAADGPQRPATSISCSRPRTNSSTGNSTCPDWRRLSTISAGKAGPSRPCRRLTSKAFPEHLKKPSSSCSNDEHGKVRDPFPRSARV